jgi:hypothetical protein
MSEQTRTTLPEGGFKVWFAVLGSIAAWLIHLSFVSSFVQYTCNVSGVVWVQHLVTAITAAVTVWTMVLSARLVREAGATDEAAGTPAGRTRFLGILGLLFGAIDLVLILTEGFYVILVHHCG